MTAAESIRSSSQRGERGTGDYPACGRGRIESRRDFGSSAVRSEGPKSNCQFPVMLRSRTTSPAVLDASAVGSTEGRVRKNATWKRSELTNDGRTTNAVDDHPLLRKGT